MAATDLWHIPYNRGFVEIDGCSKSYTSEYPEMVLIWFDFQYSRPMLHDTSTEDSYDFSDRTIRMQLKIEVDGILYPGTGPFATAQEGNVRGTGYAGLDLRSYVSLAVMLPPGRHTITPKAALGPSARLDGEWANPAFSWMENLIYPGPAFGNRATHILRLPYATELGA